MISTLREVMRTTKDRGASAVEYALMVAAVAAVIVGIVFGFGSLIGSQFDGSCKEIHFQANAAGVGRPGDVVGGTPNGCAP